MSDSDTDRSSVISDGDTDDGETEALERMIRSKPMYYILSQYLETEDGKNIADILSELVNVLKSIESKLQK